MEARGPDRLEAVAAPANALRRERKEGGDIAPDTERERSGPIHVDGDAEFREPGDPGSNHCRGVCRSAAEACSVGDALGQPDPDCERDDRPAREAPARLEA